MAERRNLIDHSGRIPICRQARLLGLSRGSVYYKPTPSREQADDELMQTLQSLQQTYPTAGSRVLREKLMEQGIHVGRRRVRNLMEKMRK